MSAVEQDCAFQCAQGTEGQRREETVPEILELVLSLIFDQKFYARSVHKFLGYADKTCEI